MVPLVQPSSIEHNRYYMKDPNATEIDNVANRHHIEISNELEKVGDAAHKALPIPQPVSKVKYVLVGMGIGAVTGAGVGAVTGSVVPGVGTAACASIGAAGGALCGGYIGYRRAVKADGINYRQWLSRLPTIEATAFKAIFNSDPELKDYLCRISQEIIRLPACLPCRHICDYESLVTSVNKFRVCPEPFCRKAGNKDQIQLAPEVFIRMNDAFLKILKSGIKGRKLTAIQLDGFKYLVQDLDERSQSVYDRLTAEMERKSKLIMADHSLSPAHKIVELNKGFEEQLILHNMRMKMLQQLSSSGKAVK